MEHCKTIRMHIWLIWLLIHINIWDELAIGFETQISGPEKNYLQ